MMKEKILPFIIGVLVGAIVATACFYIYTKSVESKAPTGFEGRMYQGGPGMNGDNFEAGEHQLKS